MTISEDLKIPKPEVLCFVDTETSGLDPDKDHLLEIACLRYHVPTASVIDARSWLLHAEHNAAESINGIPSRLLSKYGADGAQRRQVAFQVRDMLMASDVTLAWNAAFDRPWIDRFLKQEDVNAEKISPWVCAMEDMTWPKPSSSRSLSAVALAHEVGLVDAHRALPDIWTMARLFRRASELGTNIATQVLFGLRPKATYEALVNYADRNVAKNAGFRWNETSKKWTRTMARQDVMRLPFGVREILPPGKTWADTHQGLRVAVLAPDSYTDEKFVNKVLAQLSPRHVTRSLFSDSMFPELVLAFGTSEDIEFYVDQARERQIEVIRPVKEGGES